MKQSLNLGGGASEIISKTIQEGKTNYEEEEEEEEDNYPNYDNYISQYEGYDGYEGYDPLKKLEILQREKVDTLAKLGRSIDANSILLLVHCAPKKYQHNHTKFVDIIQF